MSTYLGNKSSDGSPLLHMTSDTKTAVQLDSDPGTNTVFHSDLPYILVREQFELTSYTAWGTGSGGRKFALSSELKTFRTNNADLAYLLILEDSSGNKWLHDPLPYVNGMWFYYNSGGHVTNEIVGCLNGSNYQVAYTKADSELESLTQNDIHGTISWTFRPLAVDDTDITIFRTPFRHCRQTSYSMFSWHDASIGSFVLDYMRTVNVFGGTDLRSVSNDVVSVKFVFLNVTHTSSTFTRQKDFAYDYIKLNTEDFIVNSVDLAAFSPLVSHGFNTATTTITPYTAGDLVCGKAIGVNMTQAKIDSSNQLTGGDSSVLEVLPDPGALYGWYIGLDSQIIERNGVEVFNSTWAGRALFVAGEKEITFSTSVTLTNATVTADVSSTQTGDIGTVDADTVYLASVVWDGNKLHSTSVYSVGDNMVAFFCVGEYQSIAGWRYSSNIWYYLNITSAGVCTVKRKYEPGTGNSSSNTWVSVSSVGYSLPNMTIRLISLKSL